MSSVEIESKSIPVVEVIPDSPVDVLVDINNPSREVVWRGGAGNVISKLMVIVYQAYNDISQNSLVSE